ncbi:hypothetical protein H0W80_01050 [Candidatus Saccharibacteria bacterium]|nr:hypothetical protein [Candidatus Saccharibacteria bacterium]
MSSLDFEEIMIIGDLRQSLKDTREKLGVDLTIQIPADKSELFSKLQKKYDDFYKMTLDQRLIYSGFNSHQPNVKENK